MDIGTGKDHPKNIPIHLIDIITPDETFSVSQYRQLALLKIADIHNRGRLPIVVGGTGQYLDALINPQPTFSVKPNQTLRFILNRFPVSSLSKIYSFLDRKSFESLNNSEKHNPHRLIRKIEIKLTSINKKLPALSREGLGEGFNILHLSLTAPNQFLYDRIDRRVQKRLDQGLFAEIKNLLKKYNWKNLNCLAYKEFESGFTEENINRWRFDEHGYARRQKTWFKKMSPVDFIDITASGYPQSAFDKVEKWYNLL